MDFKLTDKYGNVFDATDFGNYLSVHIAGAWCCIPKDCADDPDGYLKSRLNTLPMGKIRFRPNKDGLSNHCKGYDYMWRDKAGKWHIAYPAAPGHKDCKANGSKTMVDGSPVLDYRVPTPDNPSPYTLASPAVYVDCKCPCHHNWDPKFATSFKDKMAKDDIDDADVVNALF